MTPWRVCHRSQGRPRVGFLERAGSVCRLVRPARGPGGTPAPSELPADALAREMRRVAESAARRVGCRSMAVVICRDYRVTVVHRVAVAAA